MRLSTKLMLIFISSVIIPLVIVGYVAYDNGRDSIKQAKFDELVSINMLKADVLNNWVYNKQNSMYEMVNIPGVGELIATFVSNYQAQNGDMAALTTTVREAFGKVANDLGVTELSILRSSDGLTVFSTNEQDVGQSRENETYFLQGRKTGYTQSVFDPSTREPLGLIVGTPVKDTKGVLIGVLVTRLDMSEISAILSKSSGMSKTQDTYLLSYAGRFVTTPRLGNEHVTNEAILVGGKTPALMPQSDNFSAYGSYKNYRGVSVIGACQWLPQWSWYVQTEIDKSEAFKPIDDLSSELVVIGCVVCVVVMLMALIFSRTITRPIRRLAEGAHEIGRGNLDCKVGIKGRDEIAGLSRAFDQMAENLKKTTVSRDELAQEIAERNQAEGEVREREATYKNLIESANAIIVNLDKKGKLVFAIPMVCEGSGTPRVKY